MFYRYDESGTPVECCLLDFQLSYYASSCVDFNNLLFSTLSSEVRRENLRSFLTLYHDCYSSVFKSAGVHVEFDVNDLHEELRKHHIMGLFIASLEIPLRLIESLGIPDLNLTGEESCQNLRILKKKYFKEIMASPKLKPRLLDAFDELLEEGILEKNIPI